MSGQYGPGSEEQSDRLIGVRSLCHSVCTICAKRVVVFHFIRENTRLFYYGQFIIELFPLHYIVVFHFIENNNKFLLGAIYH